MVATSVISVAQLVLSWLSPAHAALASSSFSWFSPLDTHGVMPSWLDLPIDTDTNMRLGASVSSCTFALGPPGPPPSALCSALIAHCIRFKHDYHSRKLVALKSSSPFTSSSFTNHRKHHDDNNPLKHVAFRAGCTGATTQATDPTYLSAFTATCIVDGVDWIPFVFSDFLQIQFPHPDHPQDALSIYSSLVGCQVPARS